jgi:hypothetical protein
MRFSEPGFCVLFVGHEVSGLLSVRWAGSLSLVVGPHRMTSLDLLRNVLTSQNAFVQVQSVEVFLSRSPIFPQQGQTSGGGSDSS